MQATTPDCLQQLIEKKKKKTEANYATLRYDDDKTRHCTLKSRSTELAVCRWQVSPGKHAC